MDIIFLVIGIFFLVKGADLFVDGASSIASNIKIPTIIVGLTIVAFGTSAPEAAVSVTAALAGSNEIAISNVVGSNIFNLMMVVGAAAMIMKMHVQTSIIKEEFPILIVASLLLVVFCLTGSSISRIEALIFLLCIIAYVIRCVMTALKDRDNLEVEPAKYNTIMAVLLGVLGMAGIVLGADFVVDGASSIAKALGVSETMIGLTIVSIGTSLPEFVTSVVAARKGEVDLALGNVIGSNLFNILFILGLSGTIIPIPFASSMNIDIFIMLGCTLFVYLIAKTRKSFGFASGLVMVLFNIAYLVFVCIRA
ncbi:MAG: calcium/sodium antiporter [Erysipelotrichaceae bacterium]|nr:calcium/sodium antiporter [Erysipelotrichaceae bacterium]